jgi:hypothetical protein
MKNFQFALRAVGFVALAVFMSSASCELFQNAEDLSFTALLDHEFTINEELDQESGKAYASKPEDEVLDAAKVNADFAQHADKIEDIKINKVTYILSGYSSKYPNISFSSGTLTFSDPDATNASGAIIVDYNVANLESLSSSGEEIELAVGQTGTDAIAALLKEHKKVRIHVAGNLSSVPLYLKVKLKLDCTLKARAL